MPTRKSSLLLHFILALGFGISLAFIATVIPKKDAETQIVNLVPDELNPGQILLTDHQKTHGAALIEIDGPIPEMMRSFELRYNRKLTTDSNWESTPIRSQRLKDQDCMCFACTTNQQICSLAEKWLETGGSLYYLSPTSTGTSYILNRKSQELIIVWNREL